MPYGAYIWRRDFNRSTNQNSECELANTVQETGEIVLGNGEAHNQMVSLDQHQVIGSLASQTASLPS